MWTDLSSHAIRTTSPKTLRSPRGITPCVRPAEYVNSPDKEHLLKLLNSPLFQWGGRAGPLGGISNTQPPSAGLGFHKNSDPVRTQHVQSAGRNLGPPSSRWELSPPGNAGPGATWLQHVSWLLARARTSAQLLHPPPSNCIFPRAKMTPAIGRSGRC